jgi:hypothetical protein
VCSCILALAAPTWAQEQPPNATAKPDEAQPKAKRRSRLQGMAYLSRTRKVVGATVLVQSEDNPSWVFVTSSDDKGRFQVSNLPDGEYRVKVEREGLNPVLKQDVGLKFPFRAVVELPMQPLDPTQPLPKGDEPELPTDDPYQIVVEGTVVERSGDPMSDVVLRFVRSDGQADPRQLRTDDDGSFEIADLLAGQWRLEARGAGYLSIRIDLPLIRNTQLEIIPVRQPADYDPSPLELMPPEEPLAPADIPEVLVVE